MMSRYQTVSLSPSLPSLAINKDEGKTASVGTFFLVYCFSRDSQRIFFVDFWFLFLHSFLVSFFQRIDEWRRRPSGEHNILRVRKQMLEQNNFFFPISNYGNNIFLCLATAATNFLFLLNSTRKVFEGMFTMCRWMSSNVCVFFIVALFSFGWQKMFLTACVHKGGYKNVNFFFVWVLFLFYFERSN